MVDQANSNTATQSYREAALRRWSHWATITASVVAIAALILGSLEFHQTQTLQQETLQLQKEALDQERETSAVQIFADYNQKRIEFASNQPASKQVAFWRTNLFVSKADALYYLVGDNDSWRETIRWILNDIERTGCWDLACETTGADFVEFASDTVGRDICIPCPEKPTNESN